VSLRNLGIPGIFGGKLDSQLPMSPDRLMSQWIALPLGNAGFYAAAEEN
jgi:hypothetical protein